MFPQTLEMVEALQEDFDAKIVQSVVKSDVTNPKYAEEFTCHICGKELKSFGAYIIHVKCVHKFTNEQLDEIRNLRKIQKS
jgi:hypothetical protein